MHTIHYVRFIFFTCQLDAFFAGCRQSTWLFISCIYVAYYTLLQIQVKTLTRQIRTIYFMLSNSTSERYLDITNAIAFFQWVPEITHHCQKVPAFLLVGTQIDLRDDGNTVEKLQKNKQKPITFDQGEKLSRELRAVKYVEWSALTQVICTLWWIYGMLV